MPMLKRINLCVADMERSLSVYRDALGFAGSELKNSLPTSDSYLVFEFLKHAKLRFATLDSPTQTRVMALTEIPGLRCRALRHRICRRQSSVATTLMT